MKKKTEQIFFAAVALCLLALVGLSVFGWGLNCYKAIQLDYESPFKAEVVRIVGIFVPPVGAVAGYLTFDEEANQ